MSVVHIRPERVGEAALISRLIERAFASAMHSDGREQIIVTMLRRADALTISLVAEQAGLLLGHIAFSPVALTDGSLHWYGLAPIAVEPRVQRTGIGSALIEAGLDELRGLGAAGCVVLGEPDFYRRFGFRQISNLRYPGPPPEYFLALPFGGSVPDGEVSYHHSFTAVA
jgi:putative acetyltransferase